MRTKPLSIHSPEEARAAILSHYPDAATPSGATWCLLLDQQAQAVGFRKLIRDVSKAPSLRSLIMSCLSKKADRLVFLNTVPPGTSPVPGPHEIERNAHLKHSLAAFSIYITDIIIVSGKEMFSYYQEKVSRLKKDSHGKTDS